MHNHIACNDIWMFITTILTNPRTRPYKGYCLSTVSTFRLVHSEVRQYSHTILTIVIRTPAYRQHHPPLDSFRVWSENHSYDCSLPTSPRSITFLERDVCDVSLPCGVSGRRFGALLPHFTHRNISSPKFQA